MHFHVKSALLLLALLSWPIFLHGSEPATSSFARPNILLLLADDWGWPHASCLGDSVVRTPTFDRLAKEGVMFLNAHSAAPSCSPSRAAILTGQWPWRLADGANLHGYLPARFDVYPALLEKSGYYSGYMLKGYGPGGLGDRTQNAAGKQYKTFEAFLKERPSGKPFCFWLGSHHPHRPYQLGIGVKSGLDPAKVFVPPYLPDSPEIRSDICDYYANVEYFDQKECCAALAALERLGELDNTIVVMTGDNGWPFPRGKATNYDTGTHQTLAVRWGAKIQANRMVSDFVSLSDLAPTFLEAAGIPIPPAMTGRSLLPLLLAEGSGQIDPSRDHVLTCMERHVNCRLEANAQFTGYPRRTIVTKDFHFVRNFHPERWMAGDPNGFETPGSLPFSYEQLREDTHLAFADIDASPAKAWVVLHRADAQVKSLAEIILGHHATRELYDLRKDPYELTNVAEDPAYAEVVQELDRRLTTELAAADDPRMTKGGPEPDALPDSKDKASAP